jgi:hypothetical protein
VKTSCTSSSSAWRALPWAGLLAIVLVVAFDRFAFRYEAPWERMAIHDANSAALTRLELKQLRAQPGERPRVVVLGTSRVIDGFDRNVAEQLLPGAAFAKLAHPRFEPFAIRSLVGDLVDSGAKAVCLIASPQDTHRPLRLEPVPGSSTASLGAVRDLLGVTDLAFAVRNRLTLYRLVASSALQTYRFKLDLELAGLLKATVFPLDERLGAAPDGRRDPFRPVALWGAQRHPVLPAARRDTMDLFPPLMDQWDARIQAATAQEITRGPHVPVQMHLYRRAVEELRGAGVEVVIVEGTMHPAAADLYDPELRREFREFARGLADDLDVRFVSLEEMEPLAESDFYDLIHTVPGGAAKITRAMVAGLRRTPIDWSVGP